MSCWGFSKELKEAHMLHSWRNFIFLGTDSLLFYELAFIGIGNRNKMANASPENIFFHLKTCYLAFQMQFCRFFSNFVSSINDKEINKSPKQIKWKLSDLLLCEFFFFQLCFTHHCTIFSKVDGWGHTALHFGIMFTHLPCREFVRGNK